MCAQHVLFFCVRRDTFYIGETLYKADPFAECLEICTNCGVFYRAKFV